MCCRFVLRFGALYYSILRDGTWLLAPGTWPLSQVEIQRVLLSLLYIRTR